jgi:hypothetical protein
MWGRTIVAFGAVAAVVVAGEGDLGRMPWPDACQSNIIVTGTTASTPYAPYNEVTRL